jgi:O-antigen ligase
MNTVVRGRRHLSAAEIAAIPVDPVTWPTASIALLCCLAVVLPSGAVTAMNLYFLALAALLVTLRRLPIDAPLMRLWWLFGAMILVGLAAGIGADGSRYEYFKDAWYVSNAVVIISVGFVLARVVDSPERGLRAFVIGGVLVALGHLMWFALHPELLTLKATTIRGISGTGYYAAGLACLLLLMHWGRWREDLLLSGWTGGLALFLCSLSVVLSFSRTLTVVMLIGLLAVGGFFARREWLRVGVLLLALLASLLVLQETVDTTSVSARNSFVGKLARSLDELQANERMSVKEINDNWRGYETSRALITWRSGNAAQLLFGQGFSAQVDLGLFQNLSRNPRDAVRYIPIFHNGYVYVLVKTGLVGLGLYIAALVLLYRHGRRHALDEAPAKRRHGRLLQCCALVLAFTTWVVAGAFNKFDLFAFLLMTGFLLAMLSPREASR